jgi:hypothetical protein
LRQAEFLADGGADGNFAAVEIVAEGDGAHDRGLSANFGGPDCPTDDLIIGHRSASVKGFCRPQEDSFRGLTWELNGGRRPSVRVRRVVSGNTPNC